MWYEFFVMYRGLRHIKFVSFPLTRSEYEMRSVALFRQHFQLLAEVHFRGAPKVQFITIVFSDKIALFFDPLSQFGISF